jgi:hypothetical protein
VSSREWHEARAARAEENQRRYLYEREKYLAMNHLYQLLGDWCASYGWAPMAWLKFREQEK